MASSQLNLVRILFGASGATTPRGRMVRYGVAILLALLAQICRIPLHDPTIIPFITYVPFVLCAAWYGGLRPGLFCTLLCSIETDYFNITPAYTFWIASPAYQIGMLVFLLIGLGVSILFEHLRQTMVRESILLIEEQKLHEHLQAIVNFSDDAMLTRTNDGILTSWNRAAEQMFGYTAAEAIGRHFSMLIPEEEREKESSVLNEVRDGGMQRNRPAIRRRKDGALLHTLVSACHVRDAEGKDIGIVGITRDVTALKQIERDNESQAKELAIQKRILESVFAHAPSAVALFRGMDFVYDLVNPAYQNFLPDVEMLGRPMAEIWPDAAERVNGIFREVLATNCSQQRDMQLKLRAIPGGQAERTLWINVSYVPLLDMREPGSVDLMVVANDVGEYKRIEAGLRESEERLRLLIEHAPAALAMFDQDMCYIQCSQRWRDDYNLGDMPLIGVLHYDVFPEIPHDWKLIHQRGLRGEVVRSEADRFVRSDGHAQWIRWEVRPWRRVDGGIGGIVVFSEDITIRKEFEEEILRLNNELEERVQMRTKQLANSNHELESFAYSVSHDLRAPLRGIDGWTQAFLEDYSSTLDQQGKKYLDRVRGETQRMGHLIDDLLHLSRVTRQPMSVGLVDLSEIAVEVTERLVESYAEWKMEFVIEPGVQVRGDARLLEIVLTNLLGNAQKFSSKTPGARVEFGRSAADPSGKTLFVRDNGAGFDMKYAGQLFAPFQRLHSNAEFPGTGIGLATVQRIVLKHGWTIRAEAAPGQGATFLMTTGGTECETT